MKNPDTAAILDLGTNTFHLMVIELNQGVGWKSIYKTRATVKLGEGGIHNGYIAAEPFMRGLNALRKFAAIIKRLEVPVVYALATSGIRSAGNAEDFVSKVYATTGIKIVTIDGEREAELIAKGVLQTLHGITGPMLIMDIGGGSTEFIVADPIHLHWKKSFDIGAARLLEMFSCGGPVERNDLDRIEQYLSSELKPLRAALQLYPVHTLVGASGSFESFARMLGYSPAGKRKNPKHSNYTFSMKDYHDLHQRLLESSTDERLNMKGLLKMRVDMIVPASITLNLVLRNHRFRTLMMSDYALKEGVAFELQNGISFLN